MKKHIFIYIVLLTYSFVNVIAQQSPLITQYIFDPYIINPAYSGSKNIFNISLNVRQNMIGIDGAPKTQTISAHRPIPSQNMGIGLKLINDKIGATNTFNTLLGYSYKVAIGDGIISLGLEAGVYSYNVDFAGLIVSDIDYDIAIPKNFESKSYADASFGALYTLNSLYISYSVLHLFNNKIKYENNYVGNYNLLNKHHFFNAGYIHEINDISTVEPFILLRNIKNTPTLLDIACKYTYKNMISVGALYRTSKAFSFLFNISLKDGLYNFGYSYDHNTSKLSNYSSGSHEIMLIYKIQLLPPAGIKEINPILYL